MSCTNSSSGTRQGKRGEVLEKDAKDYADSIHAIFVETSAKNTINIHEVFIEILFYPTGQQIPILDAGGGAAASIVPPTKYHSSIGNH
ncbi:ras-related protein Rab-22A [Salmo trutta]|uniref:ras-related protein Rab-22A n=1 Tax=Salmo trutta TaxID=8032 RepID=UPI0011320E3E|nr:ras-related protein Rab-22A-like [Salmo trutta]